MADLGQGKIAFDLVTPTELAITEQVDMVVIPGAEGDIGVLPGHTPLITTLRAGLVDIHNDGRVTESLFVTGGFAEATPERCTILAESVEAVTGVTRADAEARVARARDAVASSADAHRPAAEAGLRAAEAFAQAVAMRGGA